MEEVPATVTMCPPAVRMMMVSVGVDNFDPDTGDISFWHSFWPVVAIRNVARPSPYDPGKLEHACDALFLNGEGWIDVACDEDYCKDSVSELVACPWTLEEDAARLAEKLGQLESNVRANMTGTLSPYSAGSTYIPTRKSP